MKTRITTLLLALVTSMSFGQLTFVKELDPNVNYHMPINSGQKQETKNYTEGNYIFAVSQSNDTINVLDYTFSKIKTIVLDDALINGAGLKIDIISDHLFNTDDKIEVMYSIYDKTICSIKTIIIDEDGILLQELIGISSSLLSCFSENITLYDLPQYFFQSQNEAYVILYESFENQYKTKVYKIGGNIPCSILCSSTSSATDRVKATAPTHSFNIFPNPVDGQLNIETDLNEANMQIKIYSTTGQLLKTELFFTGANQVNVSSLAAGTYVINITSDKGFLHTEQFVKK